jgi:single-stranded-DNA-specific exonuclease
MNYKWDILYTANTIQEILKNILNWKGIPKEEVRQFIDFDMTPYSPYLLSNMDKAVARIQESINKNEKVCIIGDYDADGITATSVLYIGLRSLFSNVIWQIPDRFKDGYGMNQRLIDVAYQEECQLIITVDNGIAAHEQIKYAKSLGMDVVVTDHHQFTAQELPTEITVNPQIDDSYPFKSICGCMVAFKLIMALIPDLQEKNQELYEELISIVTIGTIADVMDLKSENRYYVKQGLQYLSKPKNKGLKALMERLDLYGKEISTDKIGFIVAPCLNATGRLEKADIAVNLLLSDDQVESDKLAEKIKKLNEKRKDMQKKVVDKLTISDEDNFIIVHAENIGHGILGIIAGNIVEKYQKPCFVLGGNEEENKLSGSGRSIGGYDINSVVQSNLDIASGGGHAAACGVALKFENLEEFRKRCNEHFVEWLKTVTVDDLTPTITVVCEIGLDVVNERLVKNIDKLQPYGMGNEEPIFVTKNVHVDNFKVVGKNQNVIQFSFNDGTNYVKAVGFNGIKEKYEELREPNYIDVIYTIGLNEWPQGVFTPQLMVKDLRVKE